MNVGQKLKAAKNCLEAIEILFGYYLERWKIDRERGVSNETIVDEFYGSFLVDLEHTFKEQFPETKEYIPKHIHISTK